VNNFRIIVVIINVIIKLIMVMKKADPIDFFISANLRLTPLSKSITISVMVVKTLPNCPKYSLEIIPVEGPMIIPMTNNNNTLGILVLSNKALKT